MIQWCIWRHGFGSTLIQVMACCLMAPVHYLNHSLFILRGIQWHALESNFTTNAHERDPWHVLGYWTFDLLLHFPGISGLINQSFQPWQQALCENRHLIYHTNMYLHCVPKKYEITGMPNLMTAWVKYIITHTQKRRWMRGICCCVWSNVYMKVQQCSLKYHTKLWTHIPKNIHFTAC